MTTSIFYETDPSRPNCTIHTIAASSQIEATRTIRELMDSVDVAFGGVPGHAEFTHPFWTDGAWHANGYVEIYEADHVG